MQEKLKNVNFSLIKKQHNCFFNVRKDFVKNLIMWKNIDLLPPFSTFSLFLIFLLVWNIILLNWIYLCFVMLAESSSRTWASERILRFPLQILAPAQLYSSIHYKLWPWPITSSSHLFTNPESTKPDIGNPKMIRFLCHQGTVL